MSLRERHLWIAIVVTAGVWGLYGWRLVSHVAAGDLKGQGFAADMGGLFVLGLVLIAVGEGVLTLIARLAPRAREREGAAERRAALTASHVSLMALIALLSAVAAALFVLGLIGDPVLRPLLRWTTPANLLVLIANALLACTVLSELARYALTLAYLRTRR